MPSRRPNPCHTGHFRRGPITILTGLGGGPVSETWTRTVGQRLHVMVTACRDHRGSCRSVAHRRQPGVSAPQLVSPDKLVDIPQVGSSSSASIRQPGWSSSITEANPVTVGWRSSPPTGRPPSASSAAAGCRPHRPWTPHRGPGSANRDPESVEGRPDLDAARCGRLRGVHQRGGHVRHPRKPGMGLRRACGTGSSGIRTRYRVGHRPRAVQAPCRCWDLRRRPRPPTGPPPLLARDTIGAGEWWRPSVPTSRPRPKVAMSKRDSSAVLAPRPPVPPPGDRGAAAGACEREPRNILLMIALPAAGQHHRNAGGDVRLRCPIAAVRLLSG